MERQDYLDKYNMLAGQLSASQNALNNQSQFYSQALGQVGNSRMQGATSIGAGHIGAANALVSGQTAEINRWSLEQDAKLGKLDILGNLAGTVVGMGGLGG